MTFRLPKLSTILFLSLIFLIGLLSYRQSVSLKENHIARYVPAESERKPASLRGVIITSPEEATTKYKSKRLSFLLKSLELNLEGKLIKVSGLVRVNIYEPKQIFEYGHEIILEGKIYSPLSPTNPGQFNYKLYLARQNIYALFTVNKNDRVVLAAKNKANPLISLVIKIKDKLNYLIKKYLSPPQGLILQTFLLGSREQIPDYLEDRFIETGTVHVLSVSGLHVALLCFILILFFKALNLPRQLYLILTMFLLIVYCLLTGVKPPIVRSTIMIEIVLFGLLILRDADIYNSLALAALIILLKNPQDLFDISFQLSFISVFSIVYFSPKIEKFLSPVSIAEKIKPPKPTFFKKTKDFFIKSLAVSLAAWIGTLILVIYYFNIFSPVTILANLIVAPLVALIMASGFTFLFFGFLSSHLALIFSSAVDVFLKILLITVNFFSNLPFSFLRLPSISLWTVSLYFCVLFLITNYKKLRLSLGKLFIILLLILNILIWPQLLKPIEPNLKITFLDVGHGDSIFVEFPYGGNMLIDAGEGGDNDQGRWVISPFLWHKGINKIDALVLTHPHADHVGGLARVINNFKINYAFDNGRSLDSWSYKNYRLALKNKNIVPQIVNNSKEIIGYSQARVLILSPPEKFLTGTNNDENNNSLVLKIIFKEISFLLCADLEKEGLKELLAQETDLKAVCIKIPHHGSDQKEAQGVFLEKVNPKAAIISVAKYENNLPSPDTLAALDKIGAEIYLTSDCGAITIKSDGYKYNIETMRKKSKNFKNKL